MRSCECILYTYMVGSRADLINNTLCGVNRMHTRSGIRANCKGLRMSGDMCTSLGNGFTNLMLFYYILSLKGYTPDRVSALVEGDDGLFAVPIPCKITSDDYLKCGFTIKIEEFQDPVRASFCRLIFSNSRQCIRDPRRFLDSFGWTHSHLYANDKVMYELLRAKALSAIYETPHCPIVSVIARKALLMSEGYRPRFVYDGFHDIVPSDFNIPQFNPTSDTRQLFADLYHISIEDQIKLECRIMSGDLDCVSNILLPDSSHIFFESRFVV